MEIVSAKCNGRARVCNRTKGTLVAGCVGVADSIAARLVGLLGRRSLRPGEGLWLIHCNSIHTIGMRFPIDVAMLDLCGAVVEIKPGVLPFSIVWPNRNARSVLELPAETLAKSLTEPGDLLQIDIDVCH